MKKTYIRPDVDIVELASQKSVLTSSPLPVDNTDATDTNGYYDE